MDIDWLFVATWYSIIILIFATITQSISIIIGQRPAASFIGLVLNIPLLWVLLYYAGVL